MKIKTALLIAILITKAHFLSFGQNSNTKLYGEKFTLENPILVMDVPQMMDKRDSLSGNFHGIIETSCQVKGCWMTVRSEVGDPYRITFKDYGFFVPMEGLSGKKTTFKGTCFRSQTSVEELRHYAEDAGKSTGEIAAITQPKDEFRFVASGVKIED